ncbi:MAG: hypothetical protein KatS3mg108_3099 [Isosphaeraceae bacterium]|jgi:GNAT superfamily N-acetyltransferase|nr:MAG: hypothetical protein KatS3mg108_3099 [Isosphaeraceae bacterium]
MTSPPSGLVIREARPDDAPAIAQLNARLAHETEGKLLDPAILARGVEAALRDPDRLRYWVAHINSTIAAQAAITREWSDWRNGWLWWLQSVYVLPAHRRQGLCRALISAIQAAARSQPDVIGLRLYVEDQNLPAMATYQALGFAPARYHVFEQLWTDRLTPPGG